MVIPEQYILGMIPHHSMAIHMSRKLIQSGNLPQESSLNKFVSNIIISQEKEIEYMKQIYNK